ncbi:MAG: dual specificity protein phosphatase family protein [Terriglobales bacterium]
MRTRVRRCRAPAPVNVDLTYILGSRVAVGGGIWTAADMAELAGRGFTHVVNVQAEFDETELGAAAGLAVLWNPTEDDLNEKPPEFFERAAQFALAALRDPGARLYVHCAAGVHRGPLAAAAIVCALGSEPEAAMELIASRREGVNFPPAYALSLRRWAASRPLA